MKGSIQCKLSSSKLIKLKIVELKPTILILDKFNFFNFVNP